MVGGQAWVSMVGASVSRVGKARGSGAGLLGDPGVADLGPELAGAEVGAEELVLGVHGEGLDAHGAVLEQAVDAHRLGGVVVEEPGGVGGGDDLEVGVERRGSG